MNKNSMNLLTLPLKRRSFLNMLGAGLLGSALGFPRLAWSQEEDFALFMKLSLWLTGKATLNNTLGRRIYDALHGLDSTFASKLHSLDKHITNNNLTVAGLKQSLENGQKSLADLSSSILKAWYMGIIGEGKDALVVAYEDALMFMPVKDIMVIPSFARGPYGFWADAPAAMTVNR